MWSSSGEISRDQLEFFEKKIRPVLVDRCLNCHSEQQPLAGLRLDSRQGWEKGGNSGRAIVPGDPDASLLIRAIRHDGSQAAMPLGEDKLAPDILQSFEEWVRTGAPDPRDGPDETSSAERSWEEIYRDRSRWWSLQPVERSPVPRVDWGDWSQEPVDRFILAALEAKDLSPAPPADRATMLRRLKFTLLGLPPTPGEIAAFLGDEKPGAYVRLVDRLLDSPHFGERWARHWMDVVRYSDTYGYEWDIAARGSWRYRDYLIRAFNNDVPFDQLVREQIAGDLLPDPRVDPQEQINESLIGLMFYQMGEKRHGDSLQFNGIHQEMLDNKVDAFSKAFLATTVACARCHDHKLDAISQRDYYALAGVFMSSHWVTNTLDTPERNRQVLESLPRLKERLLRPLADWWLEDVKSVPRYLLAAQARLDQDPRAPELSRNLDVSRLGAWEKALRFESGKAPEEGKEDPADAEETSEKEEEPTLEDILYVWTEICRSFQEGQPVEVSWTQLAQEYLQVRKERSASNARGFSLVADFRKGPVDGWSMDGVGVRHGWVKNGDFAVALEGSAAVQMLLPAGLFSNALSPRLNGALRSPFLNSSGSPWISLEMSGDQRSAHRLVVDNAFLTERQKYLKGRRLEWVRFSTTGWAKGNRGLNSRERAATRTHVELATKTSNPNYPSRYGLGCTLEDIEKDDCESGDPRSWFGITRVFSHEHEESPADELRRFHSLFSGPPPGDLAEVASRYGRWLEAALTDWARSRAEEEDVRLINWMLEGKLLANETQDRESVRKLVTEYRATESRLVEPQSANGMADLEPGRDSHLNHRGVYEDLGDAVPRGQIAVLRRGSSYSPPHNSGRLELAHSVVSPENPLTARVFVNRVWHWVFGSGIVRTPNDFGHLGDTPSHPELLDYLADEFVQKGWSLKELVRSLVLSQTFQQSGQTSSRALEVDPTNRLRHHHPLQRLDAESIRDSLLAVSGRLDDRLYGSPLNPHRSKEDPFKRLFSGPLDGKGRRSIYLKMTIMEPPRFLETFNQPKPKIPIGSRDVTNVPAQALALLNDPFVAGQAEFWARRLIASTHSSTRDRLGVMFQQAFGRSPEPQELERWATAVRDFSKLHSEAADPGGEAQAMHSVAVWKDTAHAIFNAKEFIYVR